MFFRKKIELKLSEEDERNKMRNRISKNIGIIEQ